MKNFKKITKIFAAVLAATLACGAIPTSAFSFDNVDNSIYIKSSNVPESATNYAKDQFSNLTTDEVMYLGFSYEDVCGMRLAPGFYADALNDTINDTNVYYYPVLHNNEVIAMFTVTQSGIGYSYQFGKDDLATSLNTLRTSETNAAEVIVTENAFYGATADSIEVLSSLPDTEDFEIDLEKQQISQIASTVAEDAEPDDIISISSNTAYAETVMEMPMERTYIGKKRIVPIVNNQSYYDADGNKRGTCWASCTGSLIDYYKNGTACSDANGSSIRYSVIGQNFEATGGYTGGMSTAKKYIEEYISGVTMTQTGSSLAWSNVKKEVNTKNAPCYTRWECAGDSTGHAMVLCGYRYKQEDSNNTNYYGLYFMDPNKSSLQIVSYGSTYTINNKLFSWSNTLTKN